LLSELLKLDWRKRINAIDALNHPYFHMEPLPARPEDIPQFEDSHELDRRKFRGQMAALPPAPAGGTVGMGAGGDWSNGAAAQNRGGWAGNGMNGYGSGNRNGYQHPPNHHHPHGNAHDQRWDRGRPMGMGGGGGGGGGGGRDHYAPRNGYDRMNSSNTRLPGYGGGGGGGVHAHPERQSTGIRDYPPHPSLPPRPDWATADAGGNNGGRVRIPPRNAPRDRGTDKYIPSYSGHRPRSSGSNGGWNGPQRARANNYNNNNNNNHNDNNGRRRGSSGSDWEREGDPDPKVERDRRQRSRSRSRSPLRRNDRERDIEKMRERDRELYRR
jgi:serine/threonine-protein kinase BUR1